MASLKLTAQQHRRLVGNTNDQTVRNTANRREGEDFEKRLDGYHAELRTTGKALVMRTNPKIRMTGPGRAAIVGKGEVDYIAFLRDGRVCHFDAKSRGAKAFSIGDDMAHQIDWLRYMWDVGHFAGLLVYWKDYGQVRWHPVQTFDKRVRIDDGVLVDGVDWLTAIA